MYYDIVRKEKIEINSTSTFEKAIEKLQLGLEKLGKFLMPFIKGGIREGFMSSTINSIFKMVGVTDVGLTIALQFEKNANELFLQFTKNFPELSTQGRDEYKKLVQSSKKDIIATKEFTAAMSKLVDSLVKCTGFLKSLKNNN
jgi:hypothetical protein